MWLSGLALLFRIGVNGSWVFYGMASLSLLSGVARSRMMSGMIIAYVDDDLLIRFFVGGKSEFDMEFDDVGVDSPPSGEGFFDGGSTRDCLS